MATTKDRRTDLAVPDDLREAIEREARVDLRTYKAEILALLREAIEARARRK